ncbi:MAG TPA: hypothetical protein VGM50_14210, partial [Gemmatimonadaceae bacterium]
MLGVDENSQLGMPEMVDDARVTTRIFPARGMSKISSPVLRCLVIFQGYARTTWRPPHITISTGMPNQPDVLEKLVSLCKRRGFVFQSSEIYGGAGSVWDYGPLGVELKKNIKDRWWHAMVRARDDIEGLDAAILMHPRVWEASGHVAGFSD